ncbi:unnamed protein product, partial [Closterium sp. Yama58-4]
GSEQHVAAKAEGRAGVEAADGGAGGDERGRDGDRPAHVPLPARLQKLPQTRQ